MNELQKKSVLTILDDLEFKQNFSSSNMIEVWNKIDLVTRQDKKTILQQNTESRAISCSTNEGLKELMNEIDNKLDVIMGATERVIMYSLDKHFKMV